MWGSEKADTWNGLCMCFCDGNDVDTLGVGAAEGVATGVRLHSFTFSCATVLFIQGGPRATVNVFVDGGPNPPSSALPNCAVAIRLVL